MQTWFDAQLDQKILDGIYSSVPACQPAYLPQVMIAIHTGIFFPGLFYKKR